MDKKKTEQERRRDLRLGLEKPLTLVFSIKKNKGIFKLHTKKSFRVQNLSLGGISIELPPLTQKQIDRVIGGQDQLILELNIPSLKKPLRLPAKFAWLHKKDSSGKPIYVAGLSFEDLNAADREKLLSQLIGICLKSKVDII
jgi:c-di-GMP-binding flagellar brake protein YcgR